MLNQTTLGTFSERQNRLLIYYPRDLVKYDQRFGMISGRFQSRCTGSILWTAVSIGS
jgi:hypothetical protein